MKDPMNLAYKLFRLIRFSVLIVFSMFAMAATFFVIYLKSYIDKLSPEQLEQLTPLHIQEMFSEIHDLSLNTGICFLLIYLAASVAAKFIQKRQAKVEQSQPT
ncbi:hypothetical protein KEC58_22235 (plasmid) [Photobacterium damselae]|uniref:hypothetical protein n=1 Tax=Photobacterium damselae TaxID=38293 RepID=UPI0025435B03